MISTRLVFTGDDARKLVELYPDVVAMVWDHTRGLLDATITVYTHALEFGRLEWAMVIRSPAGISSLVIHQKVPNGPVKIIKE